MGKKLTDPLPPKVTTKKTAAKAKPVAKKVAVAKPTTPKAIKLPKVPPGPRKYTIIRDTREQKGQGWFFRESVLCAGTTVGTLKTGDYTIKGFEKYLCIERKGRLSEFAQNICQKRFWAELERMRVFPVAALILEFELCDVMQWPQGSGIPPWKWKYVRVSKKFILSSIKKIETEYPNIRVILAGPDGKQEAVALFKEVIASHADAT